MKEHIFLKILDKIKSIILYLADNGADAKVLYLTNSPILLWFSSKLIIPRQFFITYHHS